MYRSKHTSGVLPPRDVEELLDVTDLLRLCMTLDKLGQRCVECEETYHGCGGGVWGVLERGNCLPQLLWLNELYSSKREMPFLHLRSFLVFFTLRNLTCSQ